MDDLISEFITETTEGLAVLDLELVKLEQDPNDGAILGNIFRVMHTIKGTCGFLGLPRLESVAHASENVLGKIRDKQLQASPGAVSLVLESIDSIKAVIDHLSTHGEEPAGDDKPLINRLNHFAETGEIQSASGGAAASVADVPAEDFSAFFKGDDDLATLLAEAEAKLAQPAALVAGLEIPAPVASSVSVAVKPADAKPAAAAAQSGGGGGVDQSIRVNIEVLENLMQTVSELVLTRNQLMQIARTREDQGFLAPLQHLSHITTELQEGVMKTRMQPIGNAWSKFPRLIRDLSIELNKKIDLKMFGAETELDRQLLELIKDPLTHMVRNSCDHGLENIAERKAAGKSEMGSITLSAYHEGGHIIIEIVDDGKGINIARVKEKAIANGLVSQAEMDAMNDQQIAQFIFRAGLSTADKVTSVSGRGVGMDVVKTNIERIGGTVELSTTQGKGSKFNIKIPLTLAIVSVLIVEASGDKFAVPQINVMEIVRASPNTTYEIESINQALVLRLRDKLLPLAVLSEILGTPQDHSALAERNAFVVVCKVGGYDFGLVVDRVYDTEEIVVKPVADLIKSISVYSGNTILGDGSVIMILDPNGLARTMGEVDISRQQEVAENAALGDGGNSMSFLLFSAGGSGTPNAVPLELVSRLEEIDVSHVERAGAMDVVQYRGELMRLVTLDDSYQIPQSGVAQVIVFSYDKRVLGLVVDEILDIVLATYEIKMVSKNKNCLGSMVIEGKATNIVDVGSLLAEMIESIVSAAGANKGKASPLNLLLVEDSPFFRNLTVPFLTSAGHQVTAVEGGREALKLLTQDARAFDLVVTDIEMPEMNGFEFAQTCKMTAQIKGLPIIAYTSSLGEDVMRRGRESGIAECILKTDRPGLLQAISRCMVVAHKEAA